MAGRADIMSGAKLSIEVGRSPDSYSRYTACQTTSQLRICIRYKSRQLLQAAAIIDQFAAVKASFYLVSITCHDLLIKDLISAPPLAMGQIVQ